MMTHLPQVGPNSTLKPRQQRTREIKGRTRKNTKSMEIARVLAMFALAVAVAIGCARYNISRIHRTSMTYHIDLTSDKDPLKYILLAPIMQPMPFLILVWKELLYDCHITALPSLNSERT